MQRIIGEIPARLGSQRVKQKNLRLLNGIPLIGYAINAAKNATCLTELYVNTESEEIGTVAQKYGARFYKRKKELSTDFATSDEFNCDFINGTNADILVMINPVSPLTESSDIDGAVQYFNENSLDSLISVREEYFQALYKDNPINFAIDEMLPRTQDLTPVQLCCWNICVWRASTFKESFEKKGHAVFSGKVGFYAISKLKSIKISTEEDFLIAEQLLKMRNTNRQS